MTSPSCVWAFSRTRNASSSFWNDSVLDAIRLAQEPNAEACETAPRPDADWRRNRLNGVALAGPHFGAYSQTDWKSAADDISAET